MNRQLRELKEGLEASGCKDFWIEGMPLPIPDCVFILVPEEERWIVTFFERGRRGLIQFESAELQSACTFYHELILRESCLRLVFFGKDKSKADRLGQALKEAGFFLFRNDIHSFSGPGDVRYRIFVRGNEWDKILEQFRDLPYLENKTPDSAGQRKSDA